MYWVGFQGRFEWLIVADGSGSTLRVNLRRICLPGASNPLVTAIPAPCVDFNRQSLARSGVSPIRVDGSLAEFVEFKTLQSELQSFLLSLWWHKNNSLRLHTLASNIAISRFVYCLSWWRHGV